MTYVVGVGVGFFAFGVCTALSLARTAALADARVQRARLLDLVLETVLAELDGQIGDETGFPVWVVRALP